MVEARVTDVWASIEIIAQSLNDVDLQKTIDSLLAQDFASWDCIIHFTDDEPDVRSLRRKFRDGRIRLGKLVDDEIARGTRAQTLIRVVAGTVLTPHALKSLKAHQPAPGVMIYGDCTDWIRPNWSPVRYLNDPYFGDVVAVSEATTEPLAFLRIPVSLSEGGRRTFPTIGCAQKVAEQECERALTPRSVGVVIPTAGRSADGDPNRRAMVIELLESMGDLRDVSIVVVADSDTPPDVHEFCDGLPDIHIIEFNEPFNFAKKCNVGALAVDSDIVLFLNDDMVCLDRSWPEQVRETLAMSRVGAVGGLLLDRNGLVQSAGHANCPGPHLYGVGLDPDDPQHRSVLGLSREVSGLSGACIAVRRDVFMEVGGMCEELAEGYNDVDLGFKILMSGKSLIFNPAIKFTHFESATRDPTVNPSEYQFVSNRWGRFFRQDPFTP